MLSDKLTPMRGCFVKEKVDWEVKSGSPACSTGMIQFFRKVCIYVELHLILFRESWDLGSASWDLL